MEPVLNFLKAFFVFSPESPFIFTGIFFWIFFAGVLFADSFLYQRKKLRSVFLLLVSVFFYYKTSGLFFFLLLFTIVMDYNLSLVISRSSRKWLRLLLVTVSVTVNLSVLAYFKYAYFFTASYNTLFHNSAEVVNYLAVFANGFAGGNVFDVDKIILPVGISFYTFQTLSYTIDVYKRRLEPARSLFDFGFYVSFFPQLVAGPIVRASEFLPQLYAPYSLSRKAFGIAIFWILNGLIKKLVIGDYMAVNFIDRVFANPGMYTGFENFMSVILYSLQVYADFSGYTDIAIGVAGLMGFHLTQNFNSPYKAVSVTDFWRRWHISLSTWLRDYLYIPLGGNKRASVGTFLWLGIIGSIVGILSWQYYLAFARIPEYKFADYVLFACVSLIGVFAPLALLVYAFGFGLQKLKKIVTSDINMMITMLVGGLWHGPSWNFVIWGGLNGLGMVFYRQWRRVSPVKDNNSWPIRIFSILITFVFISLTRIFFRAADAQKSGVRGQAQELINTPEMKTAKDMLNKMWYEFNLELAPDILLAYWKVFAIFVVGMIIHWLPASWKEGYRNFFASWPRALQALFAVIAVFITYQFVSGDLQKFIYFQF